MTKSLERLATTIRRETLAELLSIGYGHFGGSLSIVEALAVLYGKHLNYDASNPAWDARDRFILSKGHAGPALYATLAVCGFFPSSELKTLNSNGTSLPSHPDRKLIPGVEMTTGSMGQGLSVAAGLAYGLRSQGSSSRVYAIVGDGELNEGQCWEALQFISHQCLTNLVVMIDDNKRQLDHRRDRRRPHPGSRQRPASRDRARHRQGRGRRVPGGPRRQPPCSPRRRR